MPRRSCPADPGILTRSLKICPAGVDLSGMKITLTNETDIGARVLADLARRSADVVAT